MKAKFIYWDAPWNMAQAIHGEKYPHFALLLWNKEDLHTVLFYTYEKRMVITSISKKETDFVILAEVEIPYEIYESVTNYCVALTKLREYAGTFLEEVERQRVTIDAVEAQLSSPEDTFLDSLGGNVDQPFPRKPKKRE